MVFIKGQSGNPQGKPKGTKNGKTLDREEAQRIFREKQSQVWEQIIQKLKPEYTADRMMGKEPDKVDVNANITISELPDEVVIKAAELLKQQLQNAD